MTIAFFCVVTFFLYALFYVPLKSEIFSMQTESRKLQVLEKNLTNFEKSHGSVEDFASLIETRLTDTRELLPAESQQDAFIAEIYKIAAANNFLVDSIQIGDVENIDDNKNLFRQSVKVKIEGDYISTLNLIREILDGKRFVTFDNITIESTENFLIGNIEFFIYHSTANL